MSSVFRVHRAGRHALLPLTALALGLSGCASMSKSGKAVAIGVGTGAVVGGVIGNNTGKGSTAKGAIIGAAVGGAIGTVIGKQMDKQAKEIKQNIPGAVVERVGEGIQVTFASGLLFDFDSDRVRAQARAEPAQPGGEPRQVPEHRPADRRPHRRRRHATGTTTTSRSAAPARPPTTSRPRASIAHACAPGPRRDRAGRVERRRVRPPAEPAGRGRDLREQSSVERWAVMWAVGVGLWALG